MATLTTTLVRDAKPKERPYEITCSGLPGFTLRVLPSGKKTFDGHAPRVTLKPVS